MATKIDIYNLALYKLAQSIAVPAITDESKAADVLNRLWDHARDLVLSERVWPWALKSQALGVDGAEAAQPGWGYRYAYPNDCLTAYAITDADGLRLVRYLDRFCDARFVESIWNRGAFDWELSYGTQGTTINTNVASAFLVYCVRVEDPGRYPAPFVDALACKLAAEAAPPLIGDVGINAKQTLLQEYGYALTNAGAHAFNQARNDRDYVTPSVASRGG